MVDTARFKQYQVLMRKIGYSVGLENTLDRLSDLSVLYEDRGRLTLGDWQELVGERWSLKGDNIGDFFGALGVLSRTKAKFEVLGGLDLLTVAASGLDGNVQKVARSVALLLMLIENDGEIFLNCLAADFRNDEIVRLLTGLIEYKRAKLFDMFRSPETQQEIARIVGIERQLKNQGGAGGGKSLSEQRRSEPLANRLESLKGPGIPLVDISDDYLRKVPGRRRDWAQSLGLWEPEGLISPTGTALLNELSNRKLMLPIGAVVLWPFSHEISRLRLNPVEFEGKIIEYWDLVRLSVIGMGGTLKDTVDAGDREAVIGVLTDQVTAFRNLNRPKAILRREYPLTLAYPSVAANFVARGQPVPNIPDVIEGERKANSSPIEVRTSRNSIGAVSLRA